MYAVAYAQGETGRQLMRTLVDNGALIALTFKGTELLAGTRVEDRVNRVHGATAPLALR